MAKVEANQPNYGTRHVRLDPRRLRRSPGWYLCAAKPTALGRQSRPLEAIFDGQEYLPRLEQPFGATDQAIEREAAIQVSEIMVLGGPDPVLCFHHVEPGGHAVTG